MSGVPNQLTEVLDNMVTNTGKTVYAYSLESPVMLVFLRQFGCMFCREALQDISNSKSNIEKLGTRLIFVHMSENEVAERYFERFHLSGAIHVSDPTARLYAEFGLTKGTFTQLFGLKSWFRGFESAILKGNGTAYDPNTLGDGFQMPGIFMISDGKLIDSFIHKVISDHPDYERMAACCSFEPDNMPRV